MSASPQDAPRPPSPYKLNIDLTFMEEYRLSEQELFWRNIQPWLKERGYMLRPRYQPDWVASWKDTSKKWRDCEDGQVQKVTHLLDATRISDGSFVMLKRVKISRNPNEIDIGRLFTEEPLASDSRNHCVPLYEVLSVPGDDDAQLIVMPLLFNAYEPRFDTIGEAVEFFRQIFEGMQFMHNQHVAHRDCKANNVMMDAAPLYPEPVHPSRQTLSRDFKRHVNASTRTEHPVRYFYIDFGHSRHYDAPGPHLEEPGYGGDRTVPEFRSNNLCDPFLVDVYRVGNIVRSITEGDDRIAAKKGFQFIKPLIDDMVQDDPTKRPNMDEVVSRFSQICSGVSSWKLRSRVKAQDENIIVGVFRSAAHWARRIRMMFRSIPPLPTP